jgi:hypothetical protein
MTGTIEVQSPALQAGASSLDRASKASFAEARTIEDALDRSQSVVMSANRSIEELRGQIVTIIGRLTNLASRLQARADKAAAFQAHDVLTLGLNDGFKAADLYAEANRAWRRVDVFNGVLRSLSQLQTQVNATKVAVQAQGDTNVGGKLAAGGFYTAHWANTLRDFDTAMQGTDAAGAAAVEKAFIKKTWFPTLHTSLTEEVVLTGAFLHSGVWGIARQVAAQRYGANVTNAQINEVFTSILRANGIKEDGSQALVDGMHLRIPAELRATLGRMPDGENIAVAMPISTKLPTISTNQINGIIGGALGGANGMGAAGVVGSVAIAVGGGWIAGSVAGGGTAAGTGAAGTEAAGAIGTGNAGALGTGGSGAAGAGAGAGAGGGGAGAASGEAAAAGGSATATAADAVTVAGDVYTPSASGIWQRPGMEVLQERIDSVGNVFHRFVDGWRAVGGPSVEFHGPGI